MEDITLISCSYNTPDVTLTMLRSFFRHHTETPVIIIDNSTNDLTKQELKRWSVPHVTNPGGLHIKSVDILIDRVQTKYALLVDTDVVFLKDHTAILGQVKECNLTLAGDICGDRGGKRIHYRVHPWHCFIDVESVRSSGVRFYNEAKQLGKSSKIYDVGCTFFEDIRGKKLRIGDIKLEGEYFKHYEGMSWRTKRYGVSEGDIDLNSEATHNSAGLYEYGLMIERKYEQEIARYRDTKIKCKVTRFEGI